MDVCLIVLRVNRDLPTLEELALKMPLIVAVDLHFVIQVLMLDVYQTA